ncbi:MltR family transcriptional regulator [Roseateles sp. NT4]|uniref:MltR family transcriptional regulator n=1 Tax=Roseateles sp. NT4 TaxID=3453715 RepID=UPI003EECC8D9
MSDEKPKQALPQLAEIERAVGNLARLSHAASAMVVAAALDRILEEALFTKMAVQNREMRDKLFSDHGVLRDFSAKIDVAFAFGVLDRQHYKLITAIRRCRNAFAHSKAILNFESAEIKEILGEGPPQLALVVDDTHFRAVASAIEAHICNAVALPMQGQIASLEPDL